MTKAEIIKALEPFADNTRVLTWSEIDPDPVSIESAGYKVVDGTNAVLLKLSSVRVGWDYPEGK